MADKALERRYLDALRIALPASFSGQVIESETPDFLIVGAGQERVGVELTRFYLPPQPGRRPHQELVRLRERVVGHAEKVHSGRGGPALYVDVYFPEIFAFRKTDVSELANELADSILSTSVPQHREEPSVKIPQSQRPKWTAGIMVHPSVDGIDRLWAADEGGWVEEVRSSHITSILRDKTRMALPARRKCDSLSLVVVNDEFSGGAPANISKEALSAFYEGPFERLIWLLPHGPRAIELHISPGSRQQL